MKQKYKAEDVLKAIYHLGALDKIDATDLKIISARDCSPMPSMRQLETQLKISHQAISCRIRKIKSLILYEISA